ncbi:MAG: glycosyltransferase family 2 protein [Anaerolineales bacterium]
MDNTPLVSIVTPSFNQAPYLEDTIQSVLRQDYPRIEYLILDGGSTDGSLELIRKYETRLAYWHSKPDQGQADAINRGLKRAKGEVVAWLNSDDLYTVGAVREAVAALTAEPSTAMVYGDGVMVDSKLNLLDPHRYRQLDVVDLLSFEVLLQPAVFMRKLALEQVGYLNRDYDLILDHELWVRLAARFQIRHVDRYWALERTHESAKTIALAREFVAEAHRLMLWAESAEETKSVVRENERRIQAGLLVFSARRLIDAERFGEATRRMFRALTLHPATAARYWYKLVQAALSALGLSSVFMAYRRGRRRVQYRGARLRPELPVSDQLDQL